MPESARRAGNFLLRRQKKVTKEEALNAIPFRTKSSLALLGPRPSEKRAASPRRRLITSTKAPTHLLKSAARRRLERTAQQPRRPSDAVFVGEPGVQPRVNRGAGAMRQGGNKSDARAQRSFSRPSRHQTHVELWKKRLFGDFSLARQRKLPARRGGLGMGRATKSTPRQAGQHEPHRHPEVPNVLRTEVRQIREQRSQIPSPTPNQLASVALI